MHAEEPEELHQERSDRSESKRIGRIEDRSEIGVDERGERGAHRVENREDRGVDGKDDDAGDKRSEGLGERRRDRGRERYAAHIVLAHGAISLDGENRQENRHEQALAVKIEDIRRLGIPAKLHRPEADEQEATHREHQRDKGIDLVMLAQEVRDTERDVHRERAHGHGIRPGEQRRVGRSEVGPGLKQEVAARLDRRRGREDGADAAEKRDRHQRDKRIADGMQVALRAQLVCYR